jgi:hypothetical protein
MPNIQNKYHHGPAKLDLIDQLFIFPKNDDIVWRAINHLNNNRENYKKNK